MPLRTITNNDDCCIAHWPGGVDELSHRSSYFSPDRTPRLPLEAHALQETVRYRLSRRIRPILIRLRIRFLGSGFRCVWYWKSVLTRFRLFTHKHRGGG